MTRDEVIDRIWLSLNRHTPAELVITTRGTYVRCSCQPDDGAPFDMPTWQRHVAEQAAEAAGRLT